MVRSPGAQFGYRVEARREILAGGRSPVSIFLITAEVTHSGQTGWGR